VKCGRASNRLKYLSGFERRLNRSLWALLWIALVYNLFQHVFLANVDEIFCGGARLGDLLYEIAVAYSVAFVFYLLVVRLPALRDRENTYRLVQPLTMRIISQAQNLMNMLTQAADKQVSRPNTRENVDEVCKSIALTSRTYPNIEKLRELVRRERHAMLGMDESTTVADVLNQNIRRAHDLNSEMLGFASLLPSQMVNLIASIDDCNFFQAWDGYLSVLSRGIVPRNPDLTDLADFLFQYLQLAELLDRYRKTFLPGEPGGPELAGVDAPLSGYTI